LTGSVAVPICRGLEAICGPKQMAVLRIARDMVEAGFARAIMGNHEFNAIAWATPDGKGGHLRPRTSKNQDQHRGFLAQMGDGSEAHADAIDWFGRLPLWLDFGELRVVHACWHRPSQQALANWLDADARLSDFGIHAAHKRSDPAFLAAEMLLKGPEVPLPNGRSFCDKDGHRRYEARLKWWDPTAVTFRAAVLGMEGRSKDIPDEPVTMDLFYTDTVPVLFGHYWMKGEPAIRQPLASCLDFSVARDGYLTAYRWSGELTLKAHNLVWVSA